MKVICPEVSRVYNCEFVIGINYCIHHYYIRGPNERCSTELEFKLRSFGSRDARVNMMLRDVSRTVIFISPRPTTWDNLFLEV